MDEYEKRMLSQLQQLNKTVEAIEKHLAFLAGEKLKTERIIRGSAIRPQETEDEPEP